MRKEERKKISFVVFVMAVFFAGVVLTAFHSYVWLMVIAGVLLLAASCFFIWDRGEKEQSASEKTSDILLVDRMAELMRGNEKAEKGVYIAVKKQHEAMEEGMSMLETRLNDLVKAQESAMKTLVLYNKENARQIALSERDEMERLCKELQDGFAALTTQLQNKSFMEEMTSPVVAATKQAGNRIYEEMHESNEAILSELGSTADGIEEMKELLSELVNGNVQVKFGNLVNELPTAPAEVPVSPDLMEEVELEADLEEDFVAEFEPELMEEEEAEPEDTFAASGVDLSDPNKTLSADDIAALFAAASEPMPVEEPEAEPMIEEEAEPEDAFAASGVDLSDPNKTLSADDIAALFAAASEPMPVEEPEPEPMVEEEAEPEDTFAASGVDLSDPNKTLSADDIAALFAAASGEASEPEPVAEIEEPAPIEEPEPVTEAEPEDALAASGVDLSDPNKTLSADDIAALFAAMGN